MEFKNRNLIYGYKFENGKLVIDNTEAKIVNQSSVKISTPSPLIIVKNSAIPS